MRLDCAEHKAQSNVSRAFIIHIMINFLHKRHKEKFQKNTRSDIKIQNIGSIESIESIESRI